jgi:CMP/dCMP kinase
VTVITISRQLGCGGEEIATQICQILGYRYLDKEMIAQVIKDEGLSESEVTDFSEEHYRTAGFLERLLRPGPYIVAHVPAAIRDERGTEMQGIKQLDEPRFIRLIRAVIHGAYNRGNVVIMGRGGQAILQELPGVLHVRLEMALGKRIGRIRERTGKSIDEVQQLALHYDRNSARYLERLFGVNWDDPLLYHLIINTGKWQTEAVAQIIVQAAKQLEAGVPASQVKGEAAV